ARLERLAVQPGAAQICREEIAGDRIEDRPGDDVAPDDGTDRDAPESHAAGEVGGAVDGVDIPAHAPGAAAALLFAEDKRVRHLAEQEAADHRLRTSVMLGDHVMEVLLV